MCGRAKAFKGTACGYQEGGYTDSRMGPATVAKRDEQGHGMYWVHPHCGHD